MSADLRQILEQLLQQATAQVGTVAKKTRITFRPHWEPEPVVEVAEGEELLHIVLCELQAPERRPDPYLGAGQRTYGEPVEIGADVEEEIPDTLEKLVEAFRDAGF